MILNTYESVAFLALWIMPFFNNVNDFSESFFTQLTITFVVLRLAQRCTWIIGHHQKIGLEIELEIGALPTRIE